MKRVTSLMLTLVLCVGLLSGCGKDFTATENTVFVLKNNKIVSTDVEDFGDTYKLEDLEAYVNDAIKVYTDEHGKDSVKLNKLTVEEGKATLIIEYETAGDYAAFNGIELFAGNVVDALAAGYSFDVDFASIEDGGAKECTKDEIIDDSDLKVVVFKGVGNLNVNGKVAYASVNNTKLVDASTIAIAEGNNLLGKAIEATTETTEVNETAPETESVSDETSDTQVDEGVASEDDLLSASEDDLLANAGTEASEMETFGFDDNEETEEAPSYTTVYTYVIYK